MHVSLLSVTDCMHVSLFSVTDCMHVSLLSVTDCMHVSLLAVTDCMHASFGVTAVARKRSRSFCQKCRWQVTAKHAYALCICLWQTACMYLSCQWQTACMYLSRLWQTVCLCLLSVTDRMHVSLLSISLLCLRSTRSPVKMMGDQSCLWFTGASESFQAMSSPALSGDVGIAMS